MSRPANAQVLAKGWLHPEQVGQLRSAATANGAEYLQQRNKGLIQLLYDIRNQLRYRVIQTTGGIYDHELKI